ncbi:MAG TPA: hypothetical protein VL588_08355 [Bdellovibrionota bacterium]|nr:hypothetical protein [Bdellovibrionota bacterium]
MADVQSIKQLFARKVAVCVEPDGVARTKLKALLAELGFTADKITIVENHRLGVKAALIKKPQVILMEYPAVGAPAIEMLAEFRKKAEAAQNTTVFYMADPGLPHAKTAAARDEVDGVLLKPLGFASVAREVGDAVRKVDQPSLYEKTLRSARAVRWAGGNVDVAIHEFQKAHGLASTESDAHASLGELELERGKPVDASKYFTEGLRINSSDYRCLVGLSRSLLDLGKPIDAYKFHEKCLRNFPLLPERVPEVLRLSLASKHLDDLVSYQELLRKWKMTDPKILRALSGALVLAARSLVIRDRAKTAVDYFKRAWELADGNPSARVSVATAMIRCGVAREAQPLLNDDAAVAQNAEVLLAQFDDIYRQGDPKQCVTFGVDLLKQGIKSPALYLGVIEKSVAMGRRRGVVEEIINQAIRDFPDQTSQFEDYRALLD